MDNYEQFSLAFALARSMGGRIPDGSIAAINALALTAKAAVLAGKDDVFDVMFVSGYLRGQKDGVGLAHIMAIEDELRMLGAGL